MKRVIAQVEVGKIKQVLKGHRAKRTSELNTWDFDTDDMPFLAGYANPPALIPVTGRPCPIGMQIDSRAQRIAKLQQIFPFGRIIRIAIH